MKRAFIIHGWYGSPQDAWFPWLKAQLETRGYAVFVPQMPEPNEPKIERWVPELARVVGSSQPSDIFIGHSIGVQTILRYLAAEQAAVYGLISVAGWFTLTRENLEDGEERIAEPWLSTPIVTESIKRHTKKIVALFSDDDPYVGQENMELFRKRLGAEIILLPGLRHIGGDEGITEVPELFHFFGLPLR